MIIVLSYYDSIAFVHTSSNKKVILKGVEQQ